LQNFVLEGEPDSLGFIDVNEPQGDDDYLLCVVDKNYQILIFNRDDESIDQVYEDF